MKPIDPNSRTQRILRFIAASAAPVTHGAIVAELRTHQSDAHVKDLGNKVSAHLCGLVDAGKVKRTGVKHDYLYQRTPTTLSGATKQTAEPPAKPARSAADHVQRPSEARTKPAPFVVPNAALTPPRLGALGSEQIAADIAAFQRRGGRIQKLKPGESSQTVQAQQEAFLASRSRKGARPKASASEAVKRNRADNDDTFDADDQVDVA
jgi:hypothetical protein